MTTGVGLTPKDFSLRNEWVEDSSGEVFDNGVPMYIIDMSSGRKYLNDSDLALRIKFSCLATVGTPVFHSISTIGHMIYRVAKLVTASHFWCYKEGENTYSLKDRGMEAGEDFIRVLMAPLSLCALEVSAIYGLFDPLNGRKLYASLERFSFYERFFLSPCFQPNPRRHFLGGDIRTRDVF